MPNRETADASAAWTKAAVVLFGFAWLTLRAPNLLAAPRFWAEEGAFVSAATRLDPLDSLVFVYWRAGYFSWATNLGATLGVHLLPLELAPVATTGLALLLQISPILAVLFLRFDFRLSGVQRAIAALVLLTTTSSNPGFAWLNTISSQMFTGILTAIVLLASADQGTRSRSWGMVLLVMATGLSGPYAVFLLPAFLVVAFADRDRWRIRQAAALSIACAIQLGVVLYKRFGLELVNEKRGGDELDFDAIAIGIRETMSSPMFGQRALMGTESQQNGLAVLSLIVLAIATAVLIRSALRTRRRGEPARLAWLGSVDLRCHLAWLTTVCAIGFVSYEGIPAKRYAIVPGALTMMIVLLAGYRTRSKLVRLLLVAVLASCVFAGLRKPRFPEDLACDGASSGWQAAARAWSGDSVVQLPHCPPGWTIEIHPDRDSGASTARTRLDFDLSPSAGP